MNDQPIPEELGAVPVDGVEPDAPAAAVADAFAAEPEVRDVAFADLVESTPPEVQTQSQNLELLLDVEIPVSVEIGRSEMRLQGVLDLVPGSVVVLDKKVDEPVDLRVNGKLVARGEVVMVDDAYGLRVTQVVAGPAGRLEGLRN